MIWLSSPHFSGQEHEYINPILTANAQQSVSQNITDFEHEMANFMGVKACAMLSSGTAALHLALILLGVEQDDVVLCSSFTFSASANPIIYQHATPIFVDSEAQTWNICPELLEKAIKKSIKSGKKPKAIVVVHLYGMPAKLKQLLKISQHYGIPIIEDAAESLGSTYENQHLGTFGTLGIVSFNVNKIITTTGGGALVSNDENLIEKAKKLASQAREPTPHYQHTQIGYNYRMSNILAGIGRTQLKNIDERVSQRRQIFETYKTQLSDCQNITFLNEPNNAFFSNRWLSTIVLQDHIFREELRLDLLKNNIETRPLWKPMHLQPVFQNHPKETNGTSEKLFETGLCLPSSSFLTAMDLEKVTLCIRNFCR